MKDIYQVTVCGKTIESRNLRQLLARAVSEKRSMQHRLRFLPSFRAMAGVSGAAFAQSAASDAGRGF